jgi:hypothetical protein
MRRDRHHLRSEYTRPDSAARKDFGGSARFAKMALLRNLVLAHAVRLRRFSHLVFVDGDLVGDTEWLPGRLQTDALSRALKAAHHNESLNLRWGGKTMGWEPHAVLSAIHNANTVRGAGNWSAVCLYSTFGEGLWYYDALALRLTPSSPLPRLARRLRPAYDAAAWNERLSMKPDSRFAREDLHMAMFALAFHREQLGAPVAVRSCFGGMAAYSLARLRATGCAYDEAGTECEHVGLSECLDRHHPDSVLLDAATPIFYDAKSHAAWHAAGGGARASKTQFADE